MRKTNIKFPYKTNKTSQNNKKIDHLSSLENNKNDLKS